MADTTPGELELRIDNDVRKQLRQFAANKQLQPIARDLCLYLGIELPPMSYTPQGFYEHSCIVTSRFIQETIKLKNIPEANHELFAATTNRVLLAALAEVLPHDFFTAVLAYENSAINPARWMLVPLNQRWTVH